MSAPGLCMGCMAPLADEGVCPLCGYEHGAPHDPNYKRPGSVLGSRYIVGRLSRSNGESALYVGYDNNLKCKVWIREYFPHTIAKREIATGNVTPNEGCGAQYKALLSDFIDVCNEVKRLSVTEPVVPIETVFPECGTVYAVYKDLDVISLESYLVTKGGKLPVVEARELLLPLFNTLSNIHMRGEIHRGVSPYTVYIDGNGSLYLWDFTMSAARTGGSELEAELFDGYSAPEQYVTNGWQGTWTDVYGAAALFYRAVSGFVPPRSTTITEEKPLAPLIDLVMELPQSISDAVKDAMEPSTNERTQEMGGFISHLVQSELSSTAIYDPGHVHQVKQARQEKRAKKEEKRRLTKYVALGLLITVLALALVFWLIMRTYFPDLINSDVNVTDPGNSTSVVDELSEEESESPQSDDSVPDFVGMRYEDIIADMDLQNRFIFSAREDYNEQYDEGIVYDQTPAAETVMPNRGTVILYISKGAPLLTMPDLTGMTLDEVNEVFLKLTGGEFDLPYDTFTRYVEGAEPGTVVSSTPAPDTEFNYKDQQIMLFLMPEGEESSQEEQQSQNSGSSQSSSSQSGEQSERSRITVEEFERNFFR